MALTVLTHLLAAMGGAFITYVTIALCIANNEEEMKSEEMNN